MRYFFDPYWWTLALALLVHLVVFTRWLYRRVRNEEIMHIFVRDMANIHLPHIYLLLEKLCDQQGIKRSHAPHIRWIDLNGRQH